MSCVFRVSRFVLRVRRQGIWMFERVEIHYKRVEIHYKKDELDDEENCHLSWII